MRCRDEHARPAQGSRETRLALLNDTTPVPAAAEERRHFFFAQYQKYCSSSFLVAINGIRRTLGCSLKNIDDPSLRQRETLDNQLMTKIGSLHNDNLERLESNREPLNTEEAQTGKARVSLERVADVWPTSHHSGLYGCGLQASVCDARRAKGLRIWTVVLFVALKMKYGEDMEHSMMLHRRIELPTVKHEETDEQVNMYSTWQHGEITSVITYDLQQGINASAREGWEATELNKNFLHGPIETSMGHFTWRSKKKKASRRVQLSLMNLLR